MFFDRPQSGERALLVHMDFASDSEREDPDEFEELVISAGAQPVLEMVAADDALLCVDDACLPPELRDPDADAPALEGVDR